MGIINTIRSKAHEARAKVRERRANAAVKAAALICSVHGENFVDSGIKILIAVVIGALLLGGLYTLFGDTIMPTVTQRVQEMFNFAG